MKKNCLIYLALITSLLSSGKLSAQTGWQWGFKSYRLGTVSGSFGESGPIALDDSFNIYSVSSEGSLDTIRIGSDTMRGNANFAALVKSNPSGAIQWTLQVGGTARVQPIGIVTDHDRNVYLFAYKQGTPITVDTVSVSTTGPYILVKINASGRVLWIKDIGVFFDFMGPRGSLGIDNAGYLYLAAAFSTPSFRIGTTTVYKSTSGGFQRDIALAKLDPNGNAIWMKSLGGKTNHEEVASIAVTRSGNFYLAGTYFSDTLFIGGTYITGNADSSDMLAPFVGNILQGNYLAKFDNSGNMAWVKNLNFHTVVAQMVTNEREEIYFSGRLDTTIILGGDTLPAHAGFYSGYTARYDSSGNVIWGRSALGYTSQGYNVAVDGCGRVWSSGSMSFSSSGGPVDFDGHILNPPSGSMLPMYYVEYDDSGNYITSHSIASGMKTPMITDPFENLYVCGMMKDYDMVMGSSTLVHRTPPFWEFFTAKYKYDTGSCVPGTPTLSTSGMAVNKQSLIVYPNPAYDEVTIVCAAKESGLIIFDLLGKQLSIPIVQGGKDADGRTIFHANVAAIPPGVYVVRAGDMVGKFLKQ